MNAKPINLETVWDDTYRCTMVARCDVGYVDVLSAIHSTVGPMLRVEIKTFTETMDVKAQANLTPDEAEALAAELLIAAKLKREHDAAWAAHQAEQLPEAA